MGNAVKHSILLRLRLVSMDTGSCLPSIARHKITDQYYYEQKHEQVASNKEISESRISL